MLPRLAELSFQGDLLSDSGYQGCCSPKPPSIMTFMSRSLPVEPATAVPSPSKAGGWLDVCFVWLSHYRRLNTAFNHKPNFFVAHV